ncbi:DUF669 domain-containing protein [Periweissella cryptocerci]|uniref:DUF669 domain-containing protein n=1 Tax=Periweissella cryptocerci TaxID=2506420 RepID=A0A4P6YX03_9LACO|nr:DUF669 domain-containing protein [Periweissella cryptocerci]QBO37384.1 DUF669 domain-containing protein [Periweissella cryptocerci]
MAYNSYRKRSFNVSKNQAREYASELEEISTYFRNTTVDISSHLDSVYFMFNQETGLDRRTKAKNFDGWSVRLSNHSYDNQYHSLNRANHVINIKSSKLDFIEKYKNVNNTLTTIFETLQQNGIDLCDVNFINYANNVSVKLSNRKTLKTLVNLETIEREKKVEKMAEEKVNARDYTFAPVSANTVGEMIITDIKQRPSKAKGNREFLATQYTFRNDIEQKYAHGAGMNFSDRTWAANDGSLKAGYDHLNDIADAAGLLGDKKITNLEEAKEVLLNQPLKIKVALRKDYTDHENIEHFSNAVWAKNVSPTDKPVVEHDFEQRAKVRAEKKAQASQVETETKSKEQVVEVHKNKGGISR